jgi:hypothetical protein
MPEEVNPQQQSNMTTGSSLRVRVVPYPKVVFFWPTAVLALVCGLFSLRNPQPLIGLIFLLVFMFNLFVISFEFSRIKFITTIMGFIMVFLILYLAHEKDIPVFRWIKQLILNVDAQANHEFYFAVTLVFFLIYLIVFISTKWNYWVIEPNEVLHYHGFMGDVHRYPAPQLKMSKEINDIFEFCLLFSGTLILSPTSESRDIVLENVLFVNKKEEKIKNLLGAIQVKIKGH